MDFENTMVTFSYDLRGADPLCVNGSDAGVANSCGIHFHEGTTCQDADSVGGHLFNTAEDPWTYGAFYTGEFGVVEVEYGLTFAETKGHTFVLHDHAGTRISCELVYVQATQELNVGNTYPDYQPVFAPTGSVELSFQSTLVSIYYDLVNADPACSTLGPNASVANSCGIHIHAGTTCDVAGEVGGHWYNEAIMSDPWTYGAYYTGDSGSLVVDYGYEYPSADGRAFVIHDRDGTRLTCDIITASNEVTLKEFMPYPQSDGGNFTVTGEVIVTHQMTFVVFEYTLEGLDQNCAGGPTPAVANSCGIHIHEGTTCDNATLVGGHFYDSNLTGGDPWTFDAFYNVAEGPQFLRVEYGMSWDDTLGRAFVLHDVDGARITCTRLEAMVTSTSMQL